MSTTTTTHNQQQHKMIGNYRLMKTIGQGVSGKVKHAIHINTGEQVAIKIIPRQQMNRPSITQAVERELAVLQLLHHPHLVELRQVMQDATNVYFIMEYMDGGDLYQLLSTQRLSEHDARTYFAQLIHALAWCHTHHICHRDLKLENILLDKEKKIIKVADFGMATMQPTATLLRTSCGSPHYASPEIIKGIPYYGPATDVWSCGVILYLLLTGYHPFDDKRTSRLLLKIKSGRYLPLPSTVSDAARNLLGKMLTVNPSERINIDHVLTHAWMLPHSPSGFPDPWFQYDQLLRPLVNQSCAMEGWIWETLKILWRGLGADRILAALLSHGPNVQKLTYRLLIQRNDRLIASYSNTIENGSPISISTSEYVTIPDSYLSNATTLYNPSPPASIASWSTEDAKRLESFSLTSTTTICRSGRYQPFFSVKRHNREQTKPSWSSEISTASIQSTTSPPYSSLLILPSTSSKQPEYDQYQSLLVWHPFYYDSAAKRLTNRVKSTNVTPKLSFGSIHIYTSHWENCNSSSMSISTMTMSNTSKSVLSLSSSLRSSSQELLQQTVRYCKRIYHRTQSMLKGFIGTRDTSTMIFSIGCSARSAWDAAGKLHQVLEENYGGQLSHRGYTHGQMIWTGSIQLSDEGNKLLFICYIPSVSSVRRVRVNFSLMKGDATEMKFAMDQLLKTLNEYERQANMISDANGWYQQQKSQM